MMGILVQGTEGEIRRFGRKDQGLAFYGTRPNAATAEILRKRPTTIGWKKSQGNMYVLVQKLLTRLLSESRWIFLWRASIVRCLYPSTPLRAQSCGPSPCHHSSDGLEFPLDLSTKSDSANPVISERRTASSCFKWVGVEVCEVNVGCGCFFARCGELPGGYLIVQ
jgi:hypothetical protein